MANNRNQKNGKGAVKTRKLARMNLANGIDSNLGPRNGYSLSTDLHPDLKADLVPIRKHLANPPQEVFDALRKLLCQFSRVSSPTLKNPAPSSRCCPSCFRASCMCLRHYTNLPHEPANFH